MKLCQKDLLFLHWPDAYMGDVFNEYQKIWNGTSNVVVHEWAPDLNTSLENLSF
jgi:hypothetical protein